MIRIYNPEAITDHIYPNRFRDTRFQGDYAFNIRLEMGGRAPQKPLQKDDFVPHLMKTFSRGKVPDFAYPLQTVGACGIGEYIYVIYGTMEGQIRKPTVARYSTSIKEWEYDLKPYSGRTDDVGPLSTMSEGGSVVSVGSNIYVISGTSTMVYDTEELTWSKATPPPGCDETLDGALCVFNEYIFLFCGSSVNKDNSILKYKTSSKKWIKMKGKVPMSPKTRTYGHRACLMNGKIYIMGLGETQSTVSCFDPSTSFTKFMTHSETLDGTRHGTIFVLNDVLYVTKVQPFTNIAQYYCKESLSWQHSKMVDLDGTMSVVMKGGVKRAPGDDNWFTLRIASITHDLETKKIRIMDKKRTLAYYDELSKIDDMPGLGPFDDGRSVSGTRDLDNWRFIRSNVRDEVTLYEKLWEVMVDVYNRKFYRKLTKIGSKFYDPFNFEPWALLIRHGF
jgi:hypothetical protein